MIGIAQNLESDSDGVVLGDHLMIQEGVIIKCTGLFTFFQLILQL